MATTLIRVRDRDTGHEYDLPEDAFDDETHVRVNAPKQYPALPTTSDRRVSARPAKYRTDKAGESTDGSGDDTPEETGR